MSGLEIVGAAIWIIASLIVLCWGGGLVFSGLLINLLAGGRKAGSGFLPFIGVILICAAFYSTHMWFNLVLN